MFDGVPQGIDVATVLLSGPGVADVHDRRVGHRFRISRSPRILCSTRMLTGHILRTGMSCALQYRPSPQLEPASFVVRAAQRQVH